MSDTPKKKLTDKEKADMAFNALAIKTMETSAKLARVETVSYTHLTLPTKA